MEIKSKTTVSLVLGSGGARGLAHIGVIRWLEANDFRIESISGCSIGALIGGIYASGKLDLFEHWIRAINKVDIVTLLDISWGKAGLIKGDKIINTLVELVGDQLIETLPISFTAVATDINNEKEIWINSGNLFDAIRASISLPLFFTPFDHNGIMLIDGGVLNPVPIAPTFHDKTEITIAVNLCGSVKRKNAPIEEIPEPEPEARSAPLREKIGRFLQRFTQPEEDDSDHDLGAYDVANQAFETMQSAIARQKLAAYPPDYVLEIPKNACGMLDFHRAAEIIDSGYEKAEKHLGRMLRDPDTEGGRLYSWNIPLKDAEKPELGVPMPSPTIELPD